MKLSNARYESIKKDVVKVLSKYNINTIPIDPFQLAKRMGISLIKYSEMDDCDTLVSNQLQKDGFIFVVYKKIFYNDKCLPNKIRFTIFHEIGHLVRNHHQFSDLAEAEANWFAAYIMAPPPLVDLFDIDEYTDIVDIFHTTLECATYSMNRYVSWKSQSRKLKDYEIELINLFKKYKNKKH